MADRKLIVQILGDASSLERTFKRLAVGAGGFIALTKAAGLLGDAIRTGIDEFSESAKVAAQTAAVIKSTGAVANVTAGQVANLGESLSRMSGIDDELIQQGENLILTFRNIRNEVGAGNDIFDRATRAALDLSVAGFGSIESTAKQLGKALNDPVKGLTALRRSGVTFTKSQEDAVKAMVRANDLLGAQRLILREVETQVGGSARALGETLPGRLNRLRETFNNLAGDVIGRFEPAISDAADAVIAWIDKTENQEKVQEAIGRTTKALVDVVTAFVGVMKDLRSILGPVVDRLGGVQTVMRNLIALAVVSKVARMARAFGLLAGQATTAAAETTALRTSLLRLRGLGPITILITLVILNRNEITKFFNDLSDKLPGGFGGEDVRVDLLDLEGLQKLRSDMQKMGGDSKEAIAQIDRLIKKILDLQNAASAGLTAAGKIEGRRGEPRGQTGGTVPEQVSATAKTIIDGLTGAIARAKEIARAAAKAAQAAIDAKDATEKQRAAFDALFDALSLQRERADVTRGFQDDLAAIRKQEQAVLAQIRAEGRTTELERQLFQIRQDRADILEQIAKQQQDQARRAREAALASRQARQFRALGLTAEGDDITPTIENLRKQLASLQARLAATGTELPSKLKSQLSGVRKILSGELGKATVETRDKIKELFDTIRGTFNREASRQLVRRVQLSETILRALGFDANLTIPRISGLQPTRPGQLTPTATAGVTITGPITVVADDPDAFLRELQKKASRTTATASGRFPGRSLGLS